MASITFDTLKFVEKLRAAGVPEEQAKAMAEAQRDIFAEVLDTSLATKTDIFALRQDMTGLGTGLRQEMAELRQEMTDLKAEVKILKWMMGLLLGGVVALILKTFFPM